MVSKTIVFLEAFREIHRGPKLCISAEHKNIVIYLCSCVFLSRFGSDLNQSEDG